MIPLGDEKKNKRLPFVTFFLFWTNVAVFVYQTLGFLFNSPLTFENHISRFAFVPNHPTLLTLATAMFMHGGWLHLLGNVWFLWVFGRRIEDELGAFKYLVFYVSMGVVATLAHLVAYPTSATPLIGASGAIAGVLGAYFVLAPWSRIKTLIPFFFIFTTARVPAFAFLGGWFLMQLLQAKMGAPYVAWWAHVGGFAAGALFVYIFK